MGLPPPWPSLSGRTPSRRDAPAGRNGAVAGLRERRVPTVPGLRLATAAQRRMDPGALAADAHARFVFAEGGTYARPVGGTEASIGRVDAGDARDFVAARYGPAEAALVMVGDLEEDEALAVAGAGFGDWRRAVPPAPEPVASPRQRARAVHVVHRAESVQSRIRVGHLGGAALGRGLLCAGRAEPGAGRIVLVAAEPQSARTTRLYLRRAVLLRAAAGTGSVRGLHRGRERGDRGGGSRDLP